MHDEVKKALIFRAPALILGIGLIAPLIAHGTLHDDLVLGSTATVVIIVVGVVIAAIGRRIPRNARVGFAVFLAVGVLTITTITLSGFKVLGDASVETLAPLVMVSAFLATATNAYGQKKRLVTVLFDGIGIGLSFTLLLCGVAGLRDAIGRNSAGGAPWNLLGSTAGIFFLAALFIYGIGLVRQRSKRGPL
jgi:Na+-translocating ferredoxin:NAD+ oxidoreductase subunit E